MKKTTATATTQVERMKQAGEIFRVATHPLRMKILDVIKSTKEVNVNEIYKELKIEQSITSQHLKLLRNIKIVNTRRDGKKIYYSVNQEMMEKIESAITTLGI